MKNWLIQPKVSLLLLATLAVSPVYAENGKCLTVNAEQGNYYVIKTKMRETTHIILPEALAIKPVVANDLWQVQGVPGTEHIWAYPTSHHEEGKFATISAVSTSGNSYDFKLVRVESGHDVCVTIKNKGGHFVSDTEGLIAASRSNLGNASEEISSLKNSLEDEKRNASAKAVEAIRRYQGTIYSDYTWTSYGSGNTVKDAVASVFDDGRFTYIRIKNDKFGLPVVFAVINGKETVVEAPYDDRTKTYRIAGLYPYIKVQAKGGGIKIKRSDLQ